MRDAASFPRESPLSEQATWLRRQMRHAQRAQRAWQRREGSLRYQYASVMRRMEEEANAAEAEIEDFPDFVAVVNSQGGDLTPREKETEK